MSSAQPTTIPIKYEFEGSLRRTIVDVPPRMAQLRQKLAQSFPSHAALFKDKSRALILKYVDDEGDEITISTKEELAAAYRFAQEAGKVLRFTVPSFETDTDTDTAVDTAQVKKTKAERKAQKFERKCQKFERKAAKRVDKVERKFTRAERKAHKKAQREVFKTERQAFKAERKAAKAQRKFGFGNGNRNGNPVDQPVIHIGVTCDGSGQCPIVGPRFHKRGANYDLCQTEFDKLDDAEKAKFIRFDWPVRVVDWSREEERPQPIVQHFGIGCDRSGQSPIIGNRYHKRGANYDLCEEEFSKITDPEERDSYVCLNRPTIIRDWDIPNVATGAQAVHVGVTCDRSGQCPIVGNRYHKRGEDYDLCEAEFAKITDEAEKAQYVRLDRRTLLRDWGRPAGPGFGPPFGAAPWHHHHRHRHPHPHARFGQHFGGFGHGCGRGRRFFRHGGRGRHHGKRSSHVEFVADVTVPDGAVVAAGTTFHKEWKLRAAGGPIPPGTTLVFVDGHDLGGSSPKLVNNGGFIAPGTEFSVVNDFTAPATPGTYRSFWRLQGPGGRRFGPRIWVEINVPQPAETTTTSTTVEDNKVENTAAEKVPDTDTQTDTDETAARIRALIASQLQAGQLQFAPPAAVLNAISSLCPTGATASPEEVRRCQELVLGMIMSGLGQ